MPTAEEVLNREFLEIRARILELGAALDRIQRADGSLAGDPRLGRISQGLEVLASSEAGRAEQVQMVFSLPYDEDWQSTLNVPRRALAAPKSATP